MNASHWHQTRMERKREQSEAEKAFRKMVFVGIESMTQADYEALSKHVELTPEQRQAFARLAAK